MSVLVVGLSHRTSPVALLERAALSGDALAKLVSDACASDHVAEVVALSTCNRVEVYAVVEKFHGGLADVSELLCRHTGLALEQLTPHLYVHYEDRAVQHLFSVTCGLESMVVGESQIVGQVRAALALGQELGTAGRVLNELVQHALRAGKRARTETGIDQAGRSLVGVGVERARTELGGLAGRRALVVGAGSMSALAATTLARHAAAGDGPAELVIANRTAARAERLAAAVGGRAARLELLAAELAAADLVVCCTGAPGTIVGPELVEAVQAERGGRQLVLLDLALPRDVDPAVRDIPGVGVVPADVDGVRAIVAEEVAGFLTSQQVAQIAPTVVALRAMAAGVVDAELARLQGRLPDLDARHHEEITRTVRRVVDKLLHGPTVRVKELASGPDGHAYAAALRELFDLDRNAVEAMTRADIRMPVEER